MCRCPHGGYQQRDGLVSHHRAVPVVKLCNWEGLSAQRIIRLGAQTMWPRPINRPATGSSVCGGEPCRLTATFTLPPPGEQVAFVCPEIVYLSLGLFCSHGMFRRARMGSETE